MPSPVWETKSPLLADAGFCSSPQGLRGGSGMSWTQQAVFIGQPGGGPQGPALFPTVGGAAPSLAGRPSEVPIPG